jgi:hypothetical protein
MPNDQFEDLNDIKEIQKEKEEAKNRKDDMAVWKPGQGLTREKGENGAHGKVW